MNFTGRQNDLIAPAQLARAIEDLPLAFASTKQPNEVDRLRHVIDRDRYIAAACLGRIRKAVEGRSWLRQAGRGCYAYDDERYQQEFGSAIDEIEEALLPLQRLAIDKINCTTEPEKVQAARVAAAASPILSTEQPNPTDAGVVIPADMKPWHGSDSAPDDIGEAAEVQYADGTIGLANKRSILWGRPQPNLMQSFTGGDDYYAGDVRNKWIVAYTPRKEAARPDVVAAVAKIIHDEVEGVTGPNDDSEGGHYARAARKILAALPTGQTQGEAGEWVSRQAVVAERDRLRIVAEDGNLSELNRNGAFQSACALDRVLSASPTPEPKHTGEGA